MAGIDPVGDYSPGPRYRPSWPNILRAVLYIAVSRPRSLGRDGLLALRDAPLPPLVRGPDHIPTEGRLVIIANHYERPGLWMAWPAVFMSALVLLRAQSDIRWIAIQEWESFSLAGIPIPPWMTRFVFERAFRAYCIIAMPPPDAPAPTRAGAMRSALHLLRRNGVIGLMPEGTVGPTPELLTPPVGVGSFMLLLAGTGARFLPLGIYEEEERLVLHAGETFQLAAPANMSREARDEWASTTAMCRIKNLIPEALWGAYRES